MQNNIFGGGGQTGPSIGGGGQPGALVGGGGQPDTFG